MQGDFGHVLQLRADHLLLEMVQNRLDQLRPDRPSPVCRQDSQCHDVDSLFTLVVLVVTLFLVVIAVLLFAGIVFVVVLVFVVAFTTIVAINRFYPCACGTDDKPVPVSKLTQPIALACRNVFVVFFLVLNRETRQIYLSQLEDEWKKARHGTTHQNIANE